MITYDYYRIFYYVAQYKSFTKAARALHNNQPNITRCMNNLEQELKCTLFLRSNKGIALTPEGRQLLEDLKLFETWKPDVVLYDVLGDVVCGGFAAPIREGYAEKVLIVTSGEKMALYAADNISKAVKNFEDRSYARVFGIVLNHRNVENETEKVQAFAEKSNIPIVGEIPRSDEIIRCEDQGKTVIEGDENSEISEKFFALARKLLESEGTEKEGV